MPHETVKEVSILQQYCYVPFSSPPGGGGYSVGSPYIRMIAGMIVVFFMGCNRRCSIFLDGSQAKSIN